MKKRMVSILVGVLFTMSLVGCGESFSGSPLGSSTQTDEGGGGTIKIICPYGVGGTTDAIARKYALVANKHSDYNFVVENMTGGDGFQGTNWYTDQPTTTRDLLIFGAGVAYRHDIGKKFNTEVVDFDRNDVYPIVDIDDRTWILYATPETTLEEVLNKAKEGNLKMSGGNPLSAPHLALGSLLAMEGGTVMAIPYDGGSAQKKGLTDGEVDVFVGSTQAALEDVKSGSIVPILAFSEEPFEGFETPAGSISVPCIAGEGIAPELDPQKDYTDSILPSGGHIAVRTGADSEWVDEIIEISKQVWGDPEFSDWIEEILLNRRELYGDDAKDFMNENCEKAIRAYEILSEGK